MELNQFYLQWLEDNECDHDIRVSGNKRKLLTCMPIYDTIVNNNVGYY